MPVYHFTLHAYRTWSPDHLRGFVQRERGIQPPNEPLAREYDRVAKFEPVEFDRALQQVLICGLIDICQRRSWRLHAIGTDPSHVHFVSSWQDELLAWQDVRDKTKNILSFLLGKATGQSGRPWFVQYGSRKQVKDHDHLAYLINEYLPSHRGLFWKEGAPPPGGLADLL